MPLPPAWATVGVGGTGVGGAGVGVWETAVGTDPPPLGGATVDAGASPPPLPQATTNSRATATTNASRMISTSSHYASDESFYQSVQTYKQQLLAAGKPEKVALTECLRKLLPTAPYTPGVPP